MRIWKVKAHNPVETIAKSKYFAFLWIIFFFRIKTIVPISKPITRKDVKD
jgi:hypothetical protein